MLWGASLMRASSQELRTALHVACSRFHGHASTPNEDVAHALIDGGANPRAADLVRCFPPNHQPTVWAGAAAHLHTRARPRPMPRPPVPNGLLQRGFTPVMRAASAGCASLVDRVLAASPGCVSDRNRAGKSLLHYCAWVKSEATFLAVLRASPAAAFFAGGRDPRSDFLQAVAPVTRSSGSDAELIALIKAAAPGATGDLLAVFIEVMGGWSTPSQLEALVAAQPSSTTGAAEERVLLQAAADGRFHHQIRMYNIRIQLHSLTLSLDHSPLFTAVWVRTNPVSTSSAADAGEQIKSHFFCVASLLSAQELLRKTKWHLVLTPNRVVNAPGEAASLLRLLKAAFGFRSDCPWPETAAECVITPLVPPLC